MNQKLFIKKSKNAGRKVLSEAKGYTLIETMIAVSIFIVIVTLGMGALLNANSLYNKSKGMRSIMDNLSFTIEDLSKNLRTGYNYQCISGNTAAMAPIASNLPLSGQNCWGIAFEPSAGGLKWAYEVISNNTIIKTTDGGTTWVQLTPTEVSINTTNSFFSVLGAEPPASNDFQQPLTAIHLTGTITYKTIVTSFSLQTSISQRQIDI